MAAALADLLPSWGGEEFSVTEVKLPGPKYASNFSNWDNGGPTLDSFITQDSFLVFHLLKQQPEDLNWLVEPVADWENNHSYMKFNDYIKKLAVVNDPAERMIGLIKPIVANFKKESSLQGALSVTEITRKNFKKTNKWRTKKELSFVKPSTLLVPPDVSDSEVEEEEEGREDGEVVVEEEGREDGEVLEEEESRENSDSFEEEEGEVRREEEGEVGREEGSGSDYEVEEVTDDD